MHDARDAEDSRLLDANDHTTLLATYYPVILERCRVRLRDPDAWEVAHAVVDRLLRELSRGKRYPVPFRVVVHKVIDWKIKEHFAGGSCGTLPEEWDAPGPDAYAEFEDRFDLERLFAGLPGRDGEVMRLRYLDLLEAAQIAEALGISANAVHQALWRGHQALKESAGG